MKDLSWNSFTKKIYIKAPIEKLFWCWTTPEGLTSWFLREAHYYRDGYAIPKNESVQVNDQYVWKWHNWEGEEKGAVLKIVKPNKIQFSFAQDCIVTVSLELEGNSTLVTLNQSNIPTDEKNKLEIFYGCSNGWTFWLANLKAFLEHGILLNETEFDLTNIDLAGFEFVNM